MLKQDDLGVCRMGLKFSKPVNLGSEVGVEGGHVIISSGFEIRGPVNLTPDASRSPKGGGGFSSSYSSTVHW